MGNIAGLCYPIPMLGNCTCDRCEAKLSLSHSMWIVLHHDEYSRR
jgi:hypothetical protein